MADNNNNNADAAAGNNAGNDNNAANAADAAAPPVQPAQPQQPPRTNINLLDITIEIPDLKNGLAADIVQAAPKASIDPTYKWPIILDLPAAYAIRCVDAVIRANYARLMRNAGANVTDVQLAALRKDAIVLGAIRAGATAAFRLTSADMNATECVNSGSKFQVENNAMTISAGLQTGAASHALALTMAPITQLETRVVAMLVYLGMAVPVLQGISLVSTGHHYLPTTKNIFAGMRRQALQIGGSDVRTWVDAMGEKFEDMAFHKACHPISPPAKRRWAKSTELAARLVASGHGAAAIRLPALPSDAQAGKAAVAVVTKAAAVIRGMGHNATWADGAALIGAVEAAAEGAAEIAAVSALRTWVVTHGTSIAFCAGIVQATTELVGGKPDTTLNAYSIKKLMGEHVSETQRGGQYARAFSTRTREQMLNGTFSDPNLTM